MNRYDTPRDRMTDAHGQQAAGRARLVAAVVMSCVVAAVGVLSLWTALRQAMPVAFGLLAAALLLYVAVWNVATWSRESEYPEGRWFTALAVLTIVSGVAALFSPLWPLGLFLICSGAVGLFWERRG